MEGGVYEIDALVLEHARIPANGRSRSGRKPTGRAARLVSDTLVYRVEKCIGAMAAVLHGEVDGILLGGAWRSVGT